MQAAPATILAYDADWLPSAVTERHAFAMAKQQLTQAPGVVYLAFPWATLIDRMQGEDAGLDDLLRALDALAETIPAGVRVVTVAQHILAGRHIELFEKARVTDLFWSHARKGETALGADGRVRVHPFPLHPTCVDAGDNRTRLDGLDAAGAFDAEATRRLCDLLAAHRFSICPHDGWPGSIGPWDAIAAGSIPVIVSDTWAPPGNPALWEEAAVFCEETPEALSALADGLEALVRDPALLSAKRQALRQLSMLYGLEDFIHDVRALFVAAAASVGEPPSAPDRPPTIKVLLYGRHNHRTPLGYPVYRDAARGRIEIVDDARDVDVLVAGFDIDLWHNAQEVSSLLRANPRLKLAVVSEEPLWDTVWSKGGGESRECRVVFGRARKRIPYIALNHVTSSVFRFERLPYFITSGDEFFVRYARLFQRNAEMTPDALLRHWERAPVRAAFYAERRSAENYDVQRPGEGRVGLSYFRTRVAELAGSDGVLRVGKGWEPGRLRQQLPDWHLDKLATLDRRARIVSGIENTHIADYVTEKFFDAFAVQAIPLYYAGPGHRGFELASGDSFLNLFGMDPEAAARRVADFTPDEAFAGAYLETQRRLAALFADPAALQAERRRVVASIVEELGRIASVRGDEAGDLASMVRALAGVVTGWTRPG
jgi:hypothetical protein